MTLTETKAKIRHARRLMREWRTAFNTRLKQEWPKCPTALNLPPDDYEAMEWGMGHLLKEWICDVDAEGERIPGTGKLVRMRGCYMRNDGTTNFMFKAIPVRCQEPYGLQR